MSADSKGLEEQFRLIENAEIRNNSEKSAELIFSEPEKKSVQEQNEVIKATELDSDVEEDGSEEDESAESEEEPSPKAEAPRPAFLKDFSFREPGASVSFKLSPMQTPEGYLLEVQVSHRTLGKIPRCLSLRLSTKELAENRTLALSSIQGFAELSEEVRGSLLKTSLQLSAQGELRVSGLPPDRFSYAFETIGALELDNVSSQLGDIAVLTAARVKVIGVLEAEFGLSVQSNLLDTRGATVRVPHGECIFQGLEKATHIHWLNDEGNLKVNEAFEVTARKISNKKGKIHLGLKVEQSKVIPRFQVLQAFDNTEGDLEIGCDTEIFKLGSVCNNQGNITVKGKVKEFECRDRWVQQRNGRFLSEHSLQGEIGQLVVTNNSAFHVNGNANLSIKNKVICRESSQISTVQSLIIQGKRVFSDESSLVKGGWTPLYGKDPKSLPNSKTKLQADTLILESPVVSSDVHIKTSQTCNLVNGAYGFDTLTVSAEGRLGYGKINAGKKMRVIQPGQDCQLQYRLKTSASVYLEGLTTGATKAPLSSKGTVVFKATSRDPAVLYPIQVSQSISAREVIYRGQGLEQIRHQVSSERTHFDLDNLCLHPEGGHSAKQIKTRRPLRLFNWHEYAFNATELLVIRMREGCVVDKPLLNSGGIVYEVAETATLPQSFQAPIRSGAYLVYLHPYDPATDSVAKEPSLKALDEAYRQQIPMLIRKANTIWAYGVDVRGETQLTQLTDEVAGHPLFSKIEFPSKRTVGFRGGQDMMSTLYRILKEKQAHFAPQMPLTIKAPSVPVRIGDKASISPVLVWALHGKVAINARTLQAEYLALYGRDGADLTSVKSFSIGHPIARDLNKFYSELRAEGPINLRAGEGPVDVYSTQLEGVGEQSNLTVHSPLRYKLFLAESFQESHLKTITEQAVLLTNTNQAYFVHNNEWIRNPSGAILNVSLTRAKELPLAVAGAPQVYQQNLNLVFETLKAALSQTNLPLPGGFRFQGGVARIGGDAYLPEDTRIDLGVLNRANKYKAWYHGKKNEDYDCHIKIGIKFKRKTKTREVDYSQIRSFDCVEALATTNRANFECEGVVLCDGIVNVLGSNFYAKQANKHDRKTKAELLVNHFTEQRLSAANAQGVSSLNSTVIQASGAATELKMAQNFGTGSAWAVVMLVKTGRFQYGEAGNRQLTKANPHDSVWHLGEFDRPSVTNIIYSLHSNTIQSSLLPIVYPRYEQAPIIVKLPNGSFVRNTENLPKMYETQTEFNQVNDEIMRQFGKPFLSGCRSKKENYEKIVRDTQQYFARLFGGDSAESMSLQVHASKLDFESPILVYEQIVLKDGRRALKPVILNPYKPEHIALYYGGLRADYLILDVDTGLITGNLIADKGMSLKARKLDVRQLQRVVTQHVTVTETSRKLLHKKTNHQTLTLTTITSEKGSGNIVVLDGLLNVDIEDFHLQGAQIFAKQGITGKAGRLVIVNNMDQYYGYHHAKARNLLRSHSTSQYLARFHVVETVLQSEGAIDLHCTGSARLVACRLQGEQGVKLHAEGSLLLEDVVYRHEIGVSAKSKRLMLTVTRGSHEEHVPVVLFSTAGKVEMSSGDSIQGVAPQTLAQGSVRYVAPRVRLDVRILNRYLQSKSSGLSGFSLVKQEMRLQQQSAVQLSSISLQGDIVYLATEGDLTLVSPFLKAAGDLMLRAKKEVHIKDAETLNTMDARTYSAGLQFFGSDAIQALMQKDFKAAADKLLRAFPVLGDAKTLSESRDLADASGNALKMVYNTYQFMRSMGQSGDFWKDLGKGLKETLGDVGVRFGFGDSFESSTLTLVPWLMAKNILIISDKASIEMSGPKAQAEEAILLKAPEKIDIKASVEEQHQRARDKGITPSINIFTGAPGIGVDIQQQKAQATHFKQCLFDAQKVSFLSEGEINLNGVLVQAQHAFLEAQVIRMTSLQDEAFSSSKGGGFSVSAKSVGGSLSLGSSRSKTLSAPTEIHAAQTLHIKAKSSHLTGVKIGVGNQGEPIPVEIAGELQALYEYPMPEDGDSFFHAIGIPRALVCKQLLDEKDNKAIREKLATEILDVILHSDPIPASLLSPKLETLLSDYQNAKDNPKNKQEVLKALEAHVLESGTFEAYIVGHIAQPTTLLGISPTLNAIAELNGFHLQIAEGTGPLKVTHSYQPAEPKKTLTLRYCEGGNFTLLHPKPGLFISPVLTYQDLEDFDKSQNLKLSAGFNPALKMAPLDVAVKHSDKREKHRATVSGDLDLETQSEVSTLNRDLSKAREITKKSKTHVRVFAPIGSLASFKELFEGMEQQFARIPAYFKPNNVEHYQTQALMRELEAYRKQGLSPKAIEEKLQNEKILAEIAQKGNQEFIQQYFIRQAAPIPKNVQANLAKGLTPHFEAGQDGEKVLAFAEPQHIRLEKGKGGRLNLVVQIGERPRIAPEPKAKKDHRVPASAASVVKRRPVPKAGSAKQREPSTKPLSKDQREALTTAIVGKMKEKLAQQGYSVPESVLQKIALEQLASCRSMQDIVTLGQRLKNKNIYFNSYLLEEQLRFTRLTADPSGYQLAFAPAIPLVWKGVLALVALGVICYQNQQRMGGLSEGFMSPGEQVKQLLWGDRYILVEEDEISNEPRQKAREFPEKYVDEESSSDNSLGARAKRLLWGNRYVLVEEDEISNGPRQKPRGSSEKYVGLKDREDLDGCLVHPVTQKDPKENIMIFPGEPQELTILITPPVKQQPEKEEFPIHGRHWRDSVYAGPTEAPKLPMLYMFKKQTDGRGIASKEWTVTGRIKEAQLPREGRIRFVPVEGYHPTVPLPKKDGGYKDKFDNIWKKGPSRTAGEPFEWDVQLSATGKKQLGWTSRDGNHINVSLKGRITHR